MTSISDCEVAVIGAGPYGLAVAAHLKHAGLQPRVFGQAMSFWRSHMPKGMMVRSPASNSDIDSPHDALSIGNYAAQLNLQLNYPIPLEQYVGYGTWYQANAVPDLDTRRIDRIEKISDHFVLHLDDGEKIRAKRVVVATGLANQEFKPSQFDGLPIDLVSHSCGHQDLSIFRGKRVAVIGRGQSACESAAILNEIGADVELISRHEIHWLGSQASGRKSLPGQSGVPSAQAAGVQIGHRAVSAQSDRGKPGSRPPADAGRSDAVTERCLRSGATNWLQPRLDGVKLRSNHVVVAAHPSLSKITLQLSEGESTVDHVLLATGYHVDCSRLGLFGPDILQSLKCEDASRC